MPVRRFVPPLVSTIHRLSSCIRQRKLAGKRDHQQRASNYTKSTHRLTNIQSAIDIRSALLIGRALREYIAAS